MAVKPGYKQTEVGVIPEDWDSPTLGSILKSRQLGGNYKNSELETSWPLIKMGNLSRGAIKLDKLEFIESSQSPASRDRLRKDDLLFNTRNTLELVGKVAVWRDELTEAYFNSNIMRMYFDETKVASKYFMNYIFNTPQVLKSLQGIAIGTTSVAAIYSRDLVRVRVPLPTEAEQEAIAEALSDADALIEALEQLIAKKRQIKQGAMQELPTGKRRLPGFGDDWNESLLGDLFAFSGGHSASREQLSGEGHCYLHYGDIHMSAKAFIEVSAEYHDIPKLDIPLGNVAPVSLLADGDVVFVDASEDDEGTSKHVVIVNPDKVPFISGLHTIVSKAKTDELDQLYLRYCFQTHEVKQQFRFFAVGTKVSGISKTNIAKVKLRVPSVPEQTAVATLLSDMDAELAALETRLAKARQVKQGMMQELLTGRIRLIDSAVNVVPREKKQRGVSAAHNDKAHNWHINEAVIIAVLANRFGSEAWPLARKRCTKLTYLLHRHVERQAEGYLKKAAGPYNPATRYKGPEGIAQKNDYVRVHDNGKYEGFIAGDKIAEAESYFDKWYGAEVLVWLEQFRFKKTDELELLATVDMAAEELHHETKAVSLVTVKQVIQDHPEWQAKLTRDIFSDFNIVRAIQECKELFG